MNPTYALREIWDHKFNYRWWRGRIVDHIVGGYFSRVGDGKGENILERDWDNLIILDACRYDLFESAYSEFELMGNLSKRQSVQSGTPGFLKQTFSDGTFHDIVYVTANPYVNTKLDPETFHFVDPVWEHGWSEKLQTVTPETMLDAAKKAAEKYPKKRLIIHFMQPHAPFIGEKRIDKQRESVLRQRALGEFEKPTEERVKGPFERIRTGELTKEEVWEAYRSNLNRVLPTVKKLQADLDGKTVVTSDHGNALGEFAWPFPIRIHGHPLSVTIPALVKVPWLEMKSDKRRTTTAKEPETERVKTSNKTEERLKMLGYTE